jgi:hypothetical protein
LCYCAIVCGLHVICACLQGLESRQRAVAPECSSRADQRCVYRGQQLRAVAGQGYLQGDGSRMLQTSFQRLSLQQQQLLYQLCREQHLSICQHLPT